MQESSFVLPAGFYLEKVSDVLVLRRLGGAMVGAFSARDATTDAFHRTVLEIIRRESWEPDPPRHESPALRTQSPLAARPRLRARFFGHFELLCDGEPVHLGRNGKALAILKYLLANRGRQVSQDHLMGWLWPESNLKKARWSLNSAVHGLRKLLGACPISPAGGSFVLLEEGYYRLSPSVVVATDVQEFDKLYERGRRLEAERRTEEAAAEYEAAAGLYQDDYLVEDLYEDWTMVERERLSNAYVDVLDRLAVHFMEAGRLGESMRACYRVLEKDRCHEDSHRMLMRCYARLGQRGRAMRQYRLCEKILEGEYGTVPSPETQVLRQRISLGQTNSGKAPRETPAPELRPVPKSEVQPHRRP